MSEALPHFYSPETQRAVEEILKYDALKYRESEQEKELMRQRDKLLIAIANQFYSTIREYVAHQGLLTELPVGKSQKVYDRFLSEYCKERGIPFRKIATDQDEELAYPIRAIHETIYLWMERSYYKPASDLKDL